MFGIESGNSVRIISELREYMENQGLVFKKVNLNDSSPYAILSSETSIGYRTRSKWNKTGVVFFCCKADADNLSRQLSLAVDDNSSDSIRPYAVFIPESKIRSAVEILKQNPDNTISSTPPRGRGRSGNSYQDKYWIPYYDHVKKCLLRDGYSNSDSNTETTVRDTFYLERKDSRDFLSWFQNELTLQEAKERVIELLTAANRKSSNLKTDIKYYSRDLDYFAEFLWQNRVDSETKSRYEVLQNLKNKNNVTLIRSRENGRLYVRKKYSIYNYDVFMKLKESDFYGIPKLIEINKSGDTLYTIEEYIDGKTLYEIVNEKGILDENEAGRIIMELCRILKQFHHMTPQLIHRDIKPSNIILTEDWQVFLIDFNASKEARKNTSEDTVLYGTQFFAAPEQLLGYGSSSPATDIYGLGATFNYLITGLYASQMISPGRYKSVIEKSVKMDPENRYQSVEEFEQAIIGA